MIYADSRYADGAIFKAYNSRTQAYSVTVTREFPTEVAKFYNYSWRERDRMDMVAASLLGSPDLWWRIMDYNPEVIDAFNIPIGTVLRIPSV